METLFIVAALIFWAASIFIVIRHGIHQDETISIHISWKKWSIVTAMIANTISVVLLAIAAFGWFGPHFNLGPVFYFLTGLTLLLLLTVSIIPHTTGTFAQIHLFAAWSLMVLFSFVSLDVLVELFATLSPALRAFLSVVIAWGVFLLLFVIIAPKKVQEHILIYESLQIAGFFSMFILVSYYA